jgi:2,4-dienoyl-CoA reductase-like NADH-dependent reductase (Old Yellow Enzyme family)
MKTRPHCGPLYKDYAKFHPFLWQFNCRTQAAKHRAASHGMVGALISEADGGWQPLALSPIAQRPQEPAPKELGSQDIEQLVADFVQAAKRARRLGFEAIELHMAHG